MPRYKSSQRNEDNEPVYKDVCNPITKEFREELYSHILEKYQYVMDRRKGKVTENVSVDKADGKSKEGLKFSVSVTALERDGSDVKGLARIFLEDCFVINNVTIIQGKENLFVAMPSYKTKDVDENNKPIYRDICYPVTREFREKLYTELITECEKQVKKTKEQEPPEKEQSEKKQTSRKQEKKGI